MDPTARRVVGAVVILASIVIAVWAVRAAYEAFDPFGLGRGPYAERGTTVVESLRELSELTTVEAVEATTIERGNDRGILNFLAGDRIAMLVVARVGAGVDLTGLTEDDVDIDRDAGSISIRLPEPTITYVEIDEDATRVYDRDTGIFTKGDPQLESEARRLASDVLEEDAVSAGVLDTARSATRTAVGDFLRALGFTDVDITFGSG